MKRDKQTAKKRKAEPEPESESEEEENIVESDHEGHDDESVDDVPDDEFEDDDEDDEDDAGKGDGLANTMAQLLQQQTGSKLPVLAGRKTKLMKEMDAVKKESTVVAKKREDKRRKINEKMASAASSNVEFEKQLKKLATKGVVALFNAVAKAKRDASMEEEVKKKKSSQVADSNALILKDKHTSDANKDQSKTSNLQGNKSWKAVSDDQIPLDWDKDEFDD